LSPSVSPDYVDDVRNRDHVEQFDSLKVATKFVHETYVQSSLYRVTAEDSVDIVVGGTGTLDFTAFTVDYVKIHIAFSDGSFVSLGEVKGNDFSDSPFHYEFTTTDTIYFKFTVLVTGDDEDYNATITLHSGGEICVDTARWLSSTGDKCIDFKQLGICTNGSFNPGYEFFAHEDFNSPDINCCECGGGSRDSGLCDYEDLSILTHNFLATNVAAWFACQTLFGKPATVAQDDVCKCMSGFDETTANDYNACMIRNAAGVTFGRTLKEAYDDCKAGDDYSNVERMDYQSWKIYCENKDVRSECRSCGGKWNKRGCKVSKKDKAKCGRISQAECATIGDCEWNVSKCAGGNPFTE